MTVQLLEKENKQNETNRKKNTQKIPKFHQVMSHFDQVISLTCLTELSGLQLNPYYGLFMNVSCKSYQLLWQGFKWH